MNLSLILEHVRAHPTEPIAIDTETGPNPTTGASALDPWRGAHIRGVSLECAGQGWYLPLTHPHSENIPHHQVRALLIDLNRHSPLWTLFNAKYDMSMIESYLGVRTQDARIWCTHIGAWLEDENLEIRDLKGRTAFLGRDDATQERTEMRRLMAGPTLATLEGAYYAASRLFGAFKVTRAQARSLGAVDPSYGHREMWDLTAPEMAPYAIEDAASTNWLYRYQRSLDHKHPIGLAMPREIEVARVLLDMERTGIRVNPQRAQLAYARATTRLGELDHHFAQINPNSTPQLAKLVYEDWGFPILNRTPAGAPSTARGTLELLGDDPRILALLEWRRLEKAVTAYYRPLLDAVDHEDRIHTSVNQAKVRTGRFSSERPNLFVIPREDTLSEVRRIFIPAPGFELVEFDLAQAEVRAMADMANDEALLAALNDPNRDVYSEVAETMGVPRQVAKTVVLADGYGAGENGLAVQLLKGTGRMVTPADLRRAGDLQRNLARSYPTLARTAARLEQLARRDGRIPLPPPGRFRHFRGAGHPPEEYRKAWNSACQGGIGEMLKTLMVALARDRIWERHGARFVLTVYDSLAAEVPPGQSELLCKDIQSVLDDVNYFRRVRMPLEVKVWSQ